MERKVNWNYEGEVILIGQDWMEEEREREKKKRTKVSSFCLMEQRLWVRQTCGKVQEEEEYESEQYGSFGKRSVLRAVGSH